jgi:hypothetical protein
MARVARARGAARAIGAADLAAPAVRGHHGARRPNPLVVAALGLAEQHRSVATHGHGARADLEPDRDGGAARAHVGRCRDAREAALGRRAAAGAGG